MVPRKQSVGATAVKLRRSSRHKKPVDTYVPTITKPESNTRATATTKSLDIVKGDRTTAKIGKKQTGGKKGSRAAKKSGRPTAREVHNIVEETPPVDKDEKKVSIVPEAINPEATNSEAINSEVDTSQEVLLDHFTPSALQSAGALEIDGAQLPTLTTGIHPIWQYDHFTWYGELSEQENIELYSAIMPALRLATHWITAAHLEAFWLPLWFPRQLDEGGDGDGTHVVAQALPDRTEELAGRTTAWFEELVKVKLNWQFHPLDFQQDGWATTPPTIKALKSVARTVRVNGDPGHITVIHHDFQWMLRHPDENLSTSEKLRLFFYLAVHLVRELVWHVFLYRWRLDHAHSPEPPGRSNVEYRSRTPRDSPPISPCTITQPPNDAPAAQLPVTLSAITESLIARSKGPKPPERSKVRYLFDSNGHSDALDSAWEIFMFKGAIWRIIPVAGPLPFPRVPYGIAIQVVEVKWADDDVEEVDDDDNTDVYDPMPTSHINNLFSARYWSDIENGVNTCPLLELTGRFRAKKPTIEPAQ